MSFHTRSRSPLATAALAVLALALLAPAGHT